MKWKDAREYADCDFEPGFYWVSTSEGSTHVAMFGYSSEGEAEIDGYDASGMIEDGTVLLIAGPISEPEGEEI